MKYKCFFALLAASLAFGAYQYFHPEGLSLGPGNEMVMEARTLVHEGTFGDPFRSTKTGPTATNPPLYPLFLAFCVWLYPSSSFHFITAVLIANLIANASVRWPAAASLHRIVGNARAWNCRRRALYRSVTIYGGLGRQFHPVRTHSVLPRRDPLHPHPRQCCLERSACRRGARHPLPDEPGGLVGRAPVDCFPSRNSRLPAARNASLPHALRTSSPAGESPVDHTEFPDLGRVRNSHEFGDCSLHVQQRLRLARASLRNYTADVS